MLLPNVASDAVDFTADFMRLIQKLGAYFPGVITARTIGVQLRRMDYGIDPYVTVKVG